MMKRSSFAAYVDWTGHTFLVLLSNPARLCYVGLFKCVLTETQGPTQSNTSTLPLLLHNVVVFNPADSVNAVILYSATISESSKKQMKQEEKHVQTFSPSLLCCGETFNFPACVERRGAGEAITGRQRGLSHVRLGAERHERNKPS